MATIKSYTDIEQSRKLAEILPKESADMYYSWHDERYYVVNKNCPYPYSLKEKIPCWSLAALFKLLPKSAQLEKGNVTELCRVTLPVELETSDWYIEPIDACVAMIEKLNESNLL
jgi:hypothetical protein